MTDRALTQQEPVAWLHMLTVDGELFPKPTLVPRSDQDTPLYTTPPPCKWVGLTDDEIWKDDGIMAANSGYGATFETLRELVRAVEAKLKEKNT